MQLRRVLVSLNAVLIACVFYGAEGSNIVPTALRHDFLNLYTGAVLAHQGDFKRLHDPARQFEIEKSLVPDLPAVVPFVRAPMYAALLSPLARLPIRPAFACWVALQIAMLLACWWWAARRFGANGLVWSAVFLPTAYGIANGQDCAMLLLLMIAAFALADRGRFAASGFAIGLALIKFHLLLLFPVLMIFGKRWRMLAGYIAAAALELAGSLAVGGWGGLIRYARLLLRKDIERLSPSPEMMANIYALPANFGLHAPWISACLVALVVGVVLWASRGAPLWRWFGLAIAGSLLIAPHVYEYDAAMLLLPILLAIFTSKKPVSRYAAMAAAIPAAWWMTAAHPPWAVAPALVILVFLVALAVESREAGKPRYAIPAQPPAPACV